MSVRNRDRALEQAVLARVRTQLPLLAAGSVIGIRSPVDFGWEGERRLNIGGQAVTIALCPSVLAVLDALVGANGDDRVLVLLTPVSERDLGDDVLARLHRHQLLEASRQTLLHDLAGGRSLDSGIVNEAWLASALVDHFAEVGSEGGESSVPLTKQAGVDLLLVSRLGLDPVTLDMQTVLEQVLEGQAQRGFDTIDPVLRGHLIDEVRDRWGPRLSTVLTMATRPGDLLEILLLLDVVGYPHADMAAAAARGVLLEAALGSGTLSEGDQRAMTALAVGYARTHRRDPAVVQAVDAAERFLLSRKLAPLAASSDVLPSGLDARFDAAAARLSGETLAALMAHLDADAPHQALRIERLRCALRLRRWLESPKPVITALGPALQHYLDEDGWADRALEEIGVGDPRAAVQRVLDDVRRAAIRRRDPSDQQLADRLAATASATPGSVFVVERGLEDLVAPLAAGSDARILLLVLDGMSVATALGIAETLSREDGRWREVVRDATMSRTPVLATLPSETTYSRTSLLTGSLRRGTAVDERGAFGDLPYWSGRTAQLFHKADLAGAAGSDLGSELTAALDPEGRNTHVVGVVLNSVDDTLAKGLQGNRAHLTIDDIAWLRTLLDRAWATGRTVVLLSDHGHVLDRNEFTKLHSVSGAAARWRSADGPATGEDETFVQGPRVLTEDHRGVFAATPALRYGSRARGYHGGVALAEITIPLLVFVRAGTDSPPGWTSAGRLRPTWWDGDASTVSLPAPDLFQGAGQPAPQPQPSPKSPAPKQTKGSRGRSVVRSAAYQNAAQGLLAAARLPDAGVERLLDSALEAGGTIAIPEALEAIGLGSRSERGVFANLRRLLNLDGYEVLTVAEAERTITINRQLLDDQFPDRLT